MGELDRRQTQTGALFGVRPGDRSCGLHLPLVAGGVGGKVGPVLRAAQAPVVP